jgi:hypothetical protein
MSTNPTKHSWGWYKIHAKLDKYISGADGGNIDYYGQVLCQGSNKLGQPRRVLLCVYTAYAAPITLGTISAVILKT